MEDKLKKEIAALVENGRHEHTEFATGKLYSLTADVAVKFAQWYEKDVKIDLIRKNEMKTDADLFNHFITHIY